MINLYDETIKRIIAEMFVKMEDMSDIEMFYIYMTQCYPTFIEIYRELMHTELIKRGTCPDCHSDLVNSACSKCKILWEESQYE